jgi:hypothetical protein
VHIDEYDLAAAFRAAGLAQGGEALDLACDLWLRLYAPTPEMICEAALDRAATTTESELSTLDKPASS